jgi:cell shape-determining protein MreC
LLYSTLLLIAIVYISLATYRYFSAMREIMDVVIQFSDHEIKKIAGYWQSVGDLFNTL